MLPPELLARAVEPRSLCGGGAGDMVEAGLPAPPEPDGCAEPLGC
ncbi:MAG TPA: hypothetical protein VGP96_15325 [Candidatus Dormibacteraeota bacterium]|nr:hypothetical protein [Candidatus Dormibacteraeota bacterium]